VRTQPAANNNKQANQPAAATSSSSTNSRQLHAASLSVAYIRSDKPARSCIYQQQQRAVCPACVLLPVADALERPHPALSSVTSKRCPESDAISLFSALNTFYGIGFLI